MSVFDSGEVKSNGEDVYLDRVPVAKGSLLDLLVSASRMAAGNQQGACMCETRLVQLQGELAAHRDAVSRYR